MNAQIAQQAKELEYKMHQEKLQTEILVAEINTRAESIRLQLMNHDNAEANDIEKAKIAENARQFNEKLALDKVKEKDDIRIREKQIAKQGSKKS